MYMLILYLDDGTVRNWAELPTFLKSRLHLQGEVTTQGPLPILIMHIHCLNIEQQPTTSGRKRHIDLFLNPLEPSGNYLFQ
jgi:hypothetical protein